METKKEMRKRIIMERNRLEPEIRIEKSREIFKKVLLMNQYKRAETLLIYMDFRNEVVTCEFAKRCIDDGKRIAVPKVEAGHELSIYEIKDPARDIIEGYKGIPEPDSSRTKQIEPQEIDFVVIPGVAFDTVGYRVGYGAGYYDRFLHKLRHDCLKIAVAYDLQIVDSIPADLYDIPMDIVITEKRIIYR